MSETVVLQQQGGTDNDNRIVRCAIHPAIGFARIGNSPDEYFLGPEVPGRTASPDDGFKDAAGRIKRHVARFRIYGFDGDGNVVKEITAADADITWTVHIANNKAAWYAYTVAMDIPEAVACKRRNPDVSDRSSLMIDPRPRSLSGRNQRALFDSGEFLGITVPLGEARTDEDGRLLMFAGLGQSGAPDGRIATTFANNDGWYDDVADGPINATVVIAGDPVPVTAAWVITAQPDYAPSVQSIVTLYDVVYETATKLGMLPPDEISFREHIYPIFRRITLTQWVNYGFYLDFGFHSPNDFLATEIVDRLANKRTEHASFRAAIASKFRNPDDPSPESAQWPPVYGDAFEVTGSPRQWLTVTRLQYRWLQRWAQGDFKADWDVASPDEDRTLTDLSLNEQPSALDRAALEIAMGGPFHPGGEATWPLRQPLLYCAPFRIKERRADQLELRFGDTLTPDEAIAPNGPLDGNGPGGITRWMAVPWQTDVSSCGAGYETTFSPYLPTFWPARVPNHVLSQRSYEHVRDTSQDLDQRRKYFNLREDWLRAFSVPFKKKINEFVTEWDKVGIVVPRPGPTDDPSFPTTMLVEMDNALEVTENDIGQRVDPHLNT